jgi:hypothetical protein
MLLKDIKPGDEIDRNLIGKSVRMRVRSVDDNLIVCDVILDDDSIYPGGWEFDRKTGHEVDREFGWGPGHSLSYLVTDDTPPIELVSPVKATTQKLARFLRE